MGRQLTPGQAPYDAGGTPLGPTRQTLIAAAERPGRPAPATTTQPHPLCANLWLYIDAATRSLKMKPITKIFLPVLILFGLSACAVSPNQQPSAEADIESAEIGALQAEDRWVTVTGSRIRYRVSEDGTAPITSFPIIGYSQDDIEFTGVRDMQGALIILDPRID
jgi:hypothetical protein